MHSQHPPTQAGLNAWLLPSATVARLAASELVARQDVPIALRESLNLAAGGKQELLKRIKVWVDLRGLELLNQQLDESQWRQAALTYLIARQAHYSMLQRLFKASRTEVSAIRKTLRTESPPTKPKSIPTQDLERIYQAWQSICETHSSEPEQWVAIGEFFPEYPIGSLYTAIVVADQGERGHV